MEIAPGIHRIGNDIVAAYLVETEDGITVIDAGLPGFWSEFQRTLSAIGRSIADVRGLVLTHGDEDHVGFAERLRRDHGVPIYVHTDDAHRARTGEKPKSPFGEKKIGATIGFLAYAIRKGGLKTTWLKEVREVEDGDVLDLPGRPRVIAVPGHSPGSIVVHLPAAKAVFVGDALTTRHVLTGQVGPQPAPFTDDPAKALESLDRIASLDVEWILPGHGAPWHGDPQQAVAAVQRAAR